VRPPVRLQLTLLYAALLVGSTAALLGLSWWLMGDHLRRTLDPATAEALSDRLLAQYAVATVGVALLAIALGWLLAGRALAPLDALLERLRGLVDSQRRFVANASHELHSPLTVIRTEVEVTLADPDASQAELRRMGEVVLEATDRTEALLEGLLVLALSQRGVTRREPVDLAGLARRAATSVGAEADRQRVAVRLDARPAPVEGDPHLLERLVANLAENGVRHNEPGGFVELETCQRGGSAVLCVRNSGEPIAPAALERLAEPFQRLERSAERRGSGLGLSIVRSVAEAHGGQLQLRGRPEGGLEVEVAFPARAAGVVEHERERALS
jgi:signal transduction histidine kinase